MEAIRYLREKELSTVQSLDAYLDTVSGQAVSIRAEMKLPGWKRPARWDVYKRQTQARTGFYTAASAIRPKKPIFQKKPPNG